MPSVISAAGVTIRMFVRNLSRIEHPCVRVAAIVVSEINDRLSPNNAPPTTIATSHGVLHPVCSAIAEAMGVDTSGMDQAAYRKAAVDAVRQLSIDVGIPTKLEAMKEEDLDFLAQSAFADACAPGNPKEASAEDIKALIRKLM